jgi:hypothetical protein
MSAVSLPVDLQHKAKYLEILSTQLFVHEGGGEKHITGVRGLVI